MNGQAGAAGQAGETGQRVGIIDGAGLGRVGQRQGADLDLVDRGERGPVQAAFEARGIDTAMRAVEQGELGAARIEFRRTAFVGLHMGVAVAEDRAPGRGERGEGERIGGGPGRDQIDRGLRGREQVAQAVGDARHAGLGTVGRGIALVGGREGGEDLRRGRAGIVGGEPHQLWPSITKSCHSSSSTSYSAVIWPIREMPARWTLSGSPEISGCQGSRSRPSWIRR